MDLVRGLPATTGLTVFPLPAEPGQRSLLTSVTPVVASTDRLASTETTRLADHLVLSFATRTEPIGAELVALFDAMAGSLGLVPEPA